MYTILGDSNSQKHTSPHGTTSLPVPSEEHSPVLPSLQVTPPIDNFMLVSEPGELYDDSINTNTPTVLDGSVGSSSETDGTESEDSSSEHEPEWDEEEVFWNP